MTYQVTEPPSFRVPGPKRGRRAGRDKSAILTFAAQVIAERGAEATRFVDVSRASGVPVSTLQYYFGNREDLLLATFRQECARELVEMASALRTSEDPWAQLVQLVCIGVADGGLAVPTWQTWVEFWRAALRDDELKVEAHENYRQWRNLVQGVVRHGIDIGRFRADLNPEVVSFQLIALVDGIGIPVALADPGLGSGALVAAEVVTHALAHLVGVIDSV